MATIVAEEKPQAAAAPAVSASSITATLPTNNSAARDSTGKAGLSKPQVTVTKNTPATLADLQTIQAGIQQAVEKGVPATVGINIGGAFGSGVIVTEDGYVLTAGHVVGRPGRDAKITFPDGKQVHAKTLGVNRDMDSGMLKITEEGKYPHVELGRSADLRLGQWCVTLGHPGGFFKDRPPVVRAGRILYTRDDAIGTDCTIVGGDSGGPLLDTNGRVIGIHSRISDGITDNYHVPIDTYRDTWDRLVKGDSWGGPPAPGGPLLGVNGQTMPQPGQSGSPGCKVTDVFPDTPADAAGLARNDIIVGFDGETVTSMDSLQTHIAQHKVGDEITLSILRGDEKKALKVKLGRRE
ncbi:MAG TPA: S1C family serine protease [Pirellulales bacterium]|jgi:serine protease Do|nr:S1C family serine protease [Pirellulales bacterium]